MTEMASFIAARDAEMAEPGDVPILTGEAIVDTALTVVTGEPMHYREWFNRLHRAGYAVAGKDPLAVVLTNLNRHPLIERVGDGIYRRDEKAIEKMARQVNDLRKRICTVIDWPAERDPLIAQLQRAERIAASYGLIFDPAADSPGA